MPKYSTTFFKYGCVWLARIVVGTTFIISGWSKLVDPWGFIYKIEEYLNVWYVVASREVTLTCAISLSVAEFVTGMLVITGSWRRLSAIVATGFMAIMLPLTAYIAIANPVSDCGCFGEFIILSNTATFLKNILLTALCIYLLKFNVCLKGLYNHSLQWLTVVASLIFASSIAFIGYRYQPIVDFRPFKTGSTFPPETEDVGEMVFVYSKDGLLQDFSIDNLPDSTWTFVERIDADGRDYDDSFAIFDGYDDVTAVLESDRPLLLLVVNDPGAGYLYRSRLAMQFADYINARGGDMIAVLAADATGVEKWRNLAAIDVDIYTAGDTSLKMLARGDTALVFIIDGKIVWKRNIASFDPGLFDSVDDDDNILERITVIDDGQINFRLSVLWIVAMFVIYLFGFTNNQSLKKKYSVKI